LQGSARVTELDEEIELLETLDELLRTSEELLSILEEQLNKAEELLFKALDEEDALTELLDFSLEPLGSALELEELISRDSLDSDELVNSSLLLKTMEEDESKLSATGLLDSSPHAIKTDNIIKASRIKLLVIKKHPITL